MSVDPRNRIVDLGKKAVFAANKHGVEGQRAQVVLVLDISASTNALYKSGVIQRVIERMLGLAVVRAVRRNRQGGLPVPAQAGRATGPGDRQRRVHAG